MKKTTILSLLLLCCAMAVSAQKAKYVFYFIGDGMGVNQVNATESYLAELQGRIGLEPLCFASFPYGGVINTHSATNGVTDSAAGGTALACGKTTKNGALGVLADDTPITSVAKWAKDAGMKVGVATNVTINHATPAAFYGHVPRRAQAHELCHNAVECGFDYLAGSQFDGVEDENMHPGEGSTLKLMEQAGFTVCLGKESYWQKKPSKAILMQTEERQKDNHYLPYAIDRKADDLTLAQIVEAGIDVLTRDNKKGFFFAIEGGRIDMACHGNDAATFIRETVDLDEAVKVAYEFYKKHPKETLIVVTADHETGGLVLGTGYYEQHLQYLQYQKGSTDAFTRKLKQLRESTGNKVTWQQARDAMREFWGFWDNVPVNAKEESELMKVYYETFERNSGKMDENLYSSDEPLTSAARRLMASKAMVSWASGGHSNGYVPVFAIGAGAEQFVGRAHHCDNPKRIAKAAGYKAE